MIKLENISFDHCIKCTICTVYCPVAKATPLFPGPKQAGPDAERLRIKNPELVDASLKYCTNCKRCEIACPSDVKIADLIQDAKYSYVKKKFRMKLRDFALSRMDLLGKVASPFAPLINSVMRMTFLRLIMDFLVGIDYRRVFPRFAGGTFRRKARQKSKDSPLKSVLYFHGCSVNTMDHGLGYDLVNVMRLLGYSVIMPPQKCCGVPAIANSDLKRAEKNAHFNIASFTEEKYSDLPVVLTCTSGAYALKYEYANLLDLDNSALASRTEYITRFLVEHFEREEMPPLQPVPLRAAYHAPCHLERMGGVMYTLDLLKRIPGLDLVNLPSECCGLSGTYGFKSEYYEVSQAVGSRLFDQIDDATPEVVVTDCVTCKWQIEGNTGYRVIHPLTLFAMALGVHKE